MDNITFSWKKIRIESILGIVSLVMIVPFFIMNVVISFMFRLLMMPDDSFYSSISLISALGFIGFGSFGSILLAVVGGVTKRRYLVTTGTMWTVFFAIQFLVLTFLIILLDNIFPRHRGLDASNVISFCISCAIGILAAIFLMADARVSKNWHLLVFPIIMISLFAVAIVLYAVGELLLQPIWIVAYIGYDYRNATACLLFSAVIMIYLVMRKEQGHGEPEIKAQ